MLPAGTSIAGRDLHPRIQCALQGVATTETICAASEFCLLTMLGIVINPAITITRFGILLPRKTPFRALFVGLSVSHFIFTGRVLKILVDYFYKAATFACLRTSINIQIGQRKVLLATVDISVGR